jgi:hypothetical protein
VLTKTDEDIKKINTGSPLSEDDKLEKTLSRA